MQRDFQVEKQVNQLEDRLVNALLNESCRAAAPVVTTPLRAMKQKHKRQKSAKSRTHCTRSGHRFDLRSQQKFQQYMKI